MDSRNILVVDDDAEIRDLVEIYLTNEGFTVTKAAGAREALAHLSEGNFDLVVLDIMMPGMDGTTACLDIRRRLDIPIIMLSAKSEDIDKIMGLSTGADDYVTKPFNPLELVARVKSQLRRYIYLNPNSPAKDRGLGSISLDGLDIEPERHTVTKYGEDIHLTPKEFDILHLLARNRGRVFSPDEIYERVWGEESLGDSSTVMVHVRKIREKIEDDPRKPKYIKTVWGVGYKLEG